MMPIAIIGRAGRGSAGHCFFGGPSIRSEFGEVMTRLLRSDGITDQDLSERIVDLTTRRPHPSNVYLRSRYRGRPEGELALENGRRLETATFNGELAEWWLSELTGHSGCERLGSQLRAALDDARQDGAPPLEMPPAAAELLRGSDPRWLSAIDQSLAYWRNLAEFLQKCGGIRINEEIAVGIGCRCLSYPERYEWRRRVDSDFPDASFRYVLRPVTFIAVDWESASLI